MSTAANFLTLGVARLGWRAFAALTGILAARHLGLEPHGDYAAALAWCTVAATFTDLGAGVVLLRETAIQRETLGEILGNAWLLTAVAAGFSYAGLLGVGLATGEGAPPLELLAWLGAGFMLESLLVPPAQLFQGQERMHWTGLIQAGVPAITALAAVLVVLLQGDLLDFARTRLVGVAVTLPLTVAMAARELRPSVRLSRLKWLLREGLPYALERGLSIIMTHGPTIIVAASIGATEAGLHAAGQRPVGMLWVLPNLVSSVLIPRLFRDGRGDPEAQRRLTRFSASAGAVLGGVAAGGLLLGGPWLAVLLYGAPYVTAGTVIQGYAAVFAMQCFNIPLGDQLTTADRQGRRLGVLGAATLTSWSLAFILAPGLGLHAGWAGALGGEVMLTLGILGSVDLARSLSWGPIGLGLAAAAAALTVTVASLGPPAPEPNWNLVAQIALYAALALPVVGLLLRALAPGVQR